MGERKDKHLIYGGNSSVLINGVPYGGDTTCIRRIMLRADKIQEPIDFRAKITFGLGNLVETEYGNKLESEGYKIERGVRSHITLFEDLGGKPAEMWDETDLMVDGVPWEIKSISSVSAWDKIFVNNTPKWDNVAQAAHHMLINKSYVGELHYISTIYHSKTKQSNNVKKRVSVGAGDVKVFKLAFDKITGTLSVNNTVTPINVRGLKRWRDWAVAELAARNFNTQTPLHHEVLSNPKKAPSQEDGVCRYCWCKEACRIANNYQEFKSLCKELIK